MKPNFQPIWWGLLHGVNDLVAGFLLADYLSAHSYQQSFMLASLYAIIGFGGQVPVGFWLDRTRRLQLAAHCSLFFLPLAAALYFVSPAAAIIAAGIASAFVHVTGGVVCLQAAEGKTGTLGLFTAPGVLGLTAGGLLGATGAWIPLLTIGAVIFIAWGILRKPLPPMLQTAGREPVLDRHDHVMLVILVFMCFRSFLFDVVNYIAEHYENGILYMGISAFAGKIIGGFLADRIGIRRFLYGSLLMALLLFQFGKQDLLALCGGIACLQSSVPLTLLLMSRSIPQYPATATSFSLGLSIVLAGLPLYLLSDKRPLHTAFSNPWLTALLFAAVLLSALLTGKRIFRSTS